MLDRLRFPLVVFTLSVFAFMPLCLIGLRTFVSVDLNQAGYPYDAVSAEFVDRPTLQTDQVEWIPWLTDFWAEVRDGNFPLWTHNIAGGSPHGTMPYLGTLSPFNIGFAFLPDWYALNIGVALTFLAAQWGTWLMCRRWGVGTVAATIAGVLFAYTGTYLARYDDLFDGKDNPIDLTGVAVSNNGIELIDREFIASIQEKREPNSSFAQGLAVMQVMQLLEDQMGVLKV